MKKIIITISVFAAIGLVAFKLMSNKDAMAKNAKLAEETSQSIPVQIETATLQQMAKELVSTGTFEAISDLSMLSQTKGLVVKVYHQKGDFVKKGTLMAQVENDLLKADLMSKEANYKKAQTDLERFKNLAQTDAVTQRQLEDVKINAMATEAQYKSAQKLYNESFIRATANGFINEDYIQEGSNISLNNKLYDLVDVSELNLNVKLTAKNMLNLKVNDEIKVSTEVYPNATFTGKVVSIAAKADNGLKYNVEILIKNQKENPLRAGMFGKAHFHFENPSSALYINRDAIAGSIKSPQVFIVQDNQVVLKNIVIGDVLSNQIEVLEGIKAGEKVVVNGQINLQDGTAVTVINQ